MENINKFLADEDALFMDFNSGDCFPTLLNVILKQMDFKPVGKVQPFTNSYFIPYRRDDTLLYMHVNPFIFRIGLLKAEALEYLCFKDQEFRRPLIITASHKIQEHNYIDDELFCYALYSGLKPFTRCLCSYHDSLLNSLRFASYRDRKEAEQLWEISNNINDEGNSHLTQRFTKPY